MRQVYLLGNPASKRTVYLQRAAREEGLPLLLTDWKEAEETMRRQLQAQKGAELFVKIDPPLWDSCCLAELEGLAADYGRHLASISRLAESGRITFFNTPEAITALLDKRSCKETLQQTGLPVTEMLTGQSGEGHFAAERKVDRISSVEQLLEAMQAAGCRQVFIKPVCGSGAAGVAALRRQPGTAAKKQQFGAALLHRQNRDGRMVLYTCAQRHPQQGIVNTKHLHRLEKTEEIVSLLTSILAMDCIVERWYAKASCQDFCYDLRAVMQDGQMDFLLARLSRGPVTNLHLNNHPLEIAQLNLPAEVLGCVEGLCRQAMACFPGLRSAGIDILLEKGSLRPRIIEMNAQGDLIYQDIYHENRIYRRQAAMMKQWLEFGRICR